jgi:hypothetical protein
MTFSLSARGKLLRVGYSSVTVISIFRKFRASLFCHNHDQTVYFDDPMVPPAPILRVELFNPIQDAERSSFRWKWINAI